jgi:hypothetical protein
MKLKTRLSFVALGVIFGIHQRTASKIFSSILNAHFDVAKKHVWWLTKHEVQETMPDSFKLHYPKTRVIIDASEVKIQCPRAVEASVLCYSGYKSNHTAKWLVGIAPCGLITFMSRAYGGRVTGKKSLQSLPAFTNQLVHNVFFIARTFIHCLTDIFFSKIQTLEDLRSLI